MHFRTVGAGTALLDGDEVWPFISAPISCRECPRVVRFMQTCTGMQQELLKIRCSREDVHFSAVGAGVALLDGDQVRRAIAIPVGHCERKGTVSLVQGGAGLENELLKVFTLSPTSHSYPSVKGSSKN